MASLREEIAVLKAHAASAQQAAEESRDLLKETLREQKKQAIKIARLETAQRWTQRIGAALWGALGFFTLHK